jgi:hypothetical protein
MRTATSGPAAAADACRSDRASRWTAAGLPITAIPPPMAIMQAEAKEGRALAQAVDHRGVEDARLAGDEVRIHSRR